MARDFEASSKSGEKFTVREGLPEELAVIQDENWRIFRTAPDLPHVFQADLLTFETVPETEEQTELRNQMVLFMHGQVQDGQWVPKNEELQAKGVTIPEIITEYEAATGRKIDFAYVCAEEKVRGFVQVLNGRVEIFIANPGYKSSE